MLSAETFDSQDRRLKELNCTAKYIRVENED